MQENFYLAVRPLGGELWLGVCLGIEPRGCGCAGSSLCYYRISLRLQTTITKGQGPRPVFDYAVSFA